MSPQTQYKVEVNSVATKTSIVTTKVEKNYKKNVATHKIMLRHNEELKAKISITTKENYVAIENGRERRQAKTSLSQQRFQCCNKQFNQQQRSKKEICRNIFRVCRDTKFNLSNARQQDYVATKKRSVATIITCNYEKLYPDKRKYCRDKGREEPQKEWKTL